MSKEEFIELFSKNIGQEREFIMFEKPYHDYFGRINDSSFEITENHVPFKITSNARLRGFIKRNEKGIEIQIKTHLLENRNFIFIGVGIFMIIVGIVRAIEIKTIDLETIGIFLLGLFNIGFIFHYLQSNDALAIKNIKSRIQILEKRHHKMSYRN